jgi:predicted methyltransferase
MKSIHLLAAAATLALMSTTAQANPARDIAAAVADKARPEADVKRDADRKPAEMLAFTNVRAGQTVVDLLPGGGYFTRLFSKAVGAKGTVYAAYPPPRAPADPSKPPPPPAIEALAADPGFANVKLVKISPGKFAIPTPADAVWTAQNYHDLKNIKDLDILAFNKAVYTSLKPGGLYVILDHVANADTPNATSTVHRIDPAVVRKDVEAAGFKFVAEDKALRSAADDHTKGVFDPSLRGHTDQFVYKFRKPK